MIQKLKNAIMTISAIIFFILVPIASADTQTINYTYDTMHRLITADYDNPSGQSGAINYVYDNMGNRLMQTVTPADSPPNNPPNPVSEPNIQPNKMDVSINPTLSWSGGDPDDGDQVVYHIYFGLKDDMHLVGSGTQTSFDPGTLEEKTTYCWQIVSIDNHNAVTQGEVWCFATGDLTAFVMTAGHWKFDESEGDTATDSGIFNNHGTLFNSPQWLADEGRIEGAIKFDGIDDYVKVPHSDSLLFENNQLSVMFWMKADSFPVAWPVGDIIISKTDFAGGKWEGFYVDVRQGENNKGRLRLVSGACPDYYKYWTIQVPQGEWTHVAFTIDENECRLYINGKLSDTVGTNSEYTISNNRQLHIGTHEYGDYYYGGLVDDLRVYNSVLSQAALVDAAFTPTGHWKFDESVGITAKDSEIYDNHGTLFNGPQWVTDECSKRDSLQFDGIDDYVKVPHSDSLLFENNQVSVMFWMKADSFPVAWPVGDIIISKTDFAGGKWEGFYVDVRQGPNGNGRLRLVSDACPDKYAYWTVTIPQGQWTHVAFTINADECRFYINGKLSNTVATVSEYTISNNRNLHIGSHIDGTYNYAGILDDVRIYNYALSQTALANVAFINAHEGDIKGDINGDGAVMLDDAIIALRVLIGIKPSGVRSDYAISGTDVNGDCRAGQEEVIYILEVVSGIRHP